MASGLGILIVFLILIILSGLMILIRKLSDSEPKARPAAASAPVSQPAVTSAESSQLPLPVLVAVATAAANAEAGSPKWLAAAVAAFSASLDDDAVTPRAGNWSAGGAAKYDPWVSNNKVLKTAPGA